MRLFLICFAVLLVCSCSSGKPQYIPPVTVVEPEEVVQPETVKTEESPETEAVVEVKNYEEDSFLAVLLKEGTPTENIIPRSKEQIAVYKKVDLYSFYYFKKNKLVVKKDYSVAEIDQLKATNSYPAKILLDLGAGE